YNAALQISSSSTDPGAGQDARITRSLAEVLRLENKPAQGELLMTEALARQQRSSGKSTGAVVATLLALADFLESENKHGEAADRVHDAADTFLGLQGQEALKVSEFSVCSMIHAGPQRRANALSDKVLRIAATNAAWLNEVSWKLVTSEKPATWDL